MAVVEALPAAQAPDASRVLREFVLWEEGITRSNATA
jgi:hypothetical protein